jgi:hypothetical protein
LEWNAYFGGKVNPLIRGKLGDRGGKGSLEVVKKNDVAAIRSDPSGRLLR